MNCINCDRFTCFTCEKMSDGCNCTTIPAANEETPEKTLIVSLLTSLEKRIRNLEKMIFG